jgi:hypothetical protein
VADLATSTRNFTAAAKNVKTTSHFVAQGADKEKLNQAFFPVFYLGIFLAGCPSGCWAYFASATWANASFQPGFFLYHVSSNFLILVFWGFNEENPNRAFSPS